jgi:hypothetical protein
LIRDFGWIAHDRDADPEALSMNASLVRTTPFILTLLLLATVACGGDAEPSPRAAAEVVASRPPRRRSR